MRAVVQRVVRARVTVDDEEVGSIGVGLCVLVGVTHSDELGVADRMAEKLWRLRVFADQDGGMERSLADGAGAVLVVSQFTLYGDTRRGRRPGWSGAAPREVAEPLVEALVAGLAERGADVATGRFGADMTVEIANDGPVTLLLELPARS